MKQIKYTIFASLLSLSSIAFGALDQSTKATYAILFKNYLQNSDNHTNLNGIIDTLIKENKTEELNYLKLIAQKKKELLSDKIISHSNDSDIKLYALLSFIVETPFIVHGLKTANDSTATLSARMNAEVLAFTSSLTLLGTSAAAAFTILYGQNYSDSLKRRFKKTNSLLDQIEKMSA